MANEKNKKTWIVIVLVLLAIAAGVLIGYLVWGSQAAVQPETKTQPEAAVTAEAAATAAPDTVPQPEETPQPESGQADPAQTQDDAQSAAPLSAYWSADSAAAQSLRDYVSRVTDPKDAPEKTIPRCSSSTA